MNQTFEKFSDAEQALYTLGFNQGYKVDEHAKGKDELMEVLKQEYKQGKSVHPYSQGLKDGINENEKLMSFFAAVRPQNGKQLEDDFDFDL